MVLEVPLWLQPLTGDPGITYTAQQDRTAIDVLVRTAGVAGTGDLLVSQRAAGANFTVDVAAGGCVIPGTSIAQQGKYLQRSTSVASVTIAGAPASGTRTDIVVAQVRDKQAIGGTAYDWIIDKVTGTVGAGAPAVPANAIKLAEIGPIISTTPSITTSLIKDFRVPLEMAGPPQFLFDVAQSAGTVSATTTTPVVAIATQTFRLTAVRRVKFLVFADSVTGSTGGELGKLQLIVDGSLVRRAQWSNPAAGGSGDVSVGLYYTDSLSAGVDHTARVEILRVTGGSQVNIAGASLLAEILRT